VTSRRAAFCFSTVEFNICYILNILLNISLIETEDLRLFPGYAFAWIGMEKIGRRLTMVISLVAG
jgi:hypothetical protein